MWVESTHMYVGRLVIIENLPHSGFVLFTQNVDNNLTYLCLNSKNSKINIHNCTKPCTNTVQTNDDSTFSILSYSVVSSIDVHCDTGTGFPLCE